MASENQGKMDRLPLEDHTGCGGGWSERKGGASPGTSWPSCGVRQAGTGG